MPSPPARPQGYNLSDHYSRLQGTRPLVTRLDGSILPAVVVPVTGFSAYALIVYFCYLIGLTPELGASALISILTMVVALLVGYRTNSSSDRWHEGRRLWASVITQTRISLRAFRYGVVDSTSKGNLKTSLDLILAFSYALKHHLRHSSSRPYITRRADMKPSPNDALPIPPDILPYLPAKTIESWKSISCTGGVPDNLPLAIIDEIQAHITELNKSKAMDPSAASSIISTLNALTDIVTSCERIRDSPIPLAYAIHLKQMMTLYMLGIPWQIVHSVGMYVIPITAIASFTFFGVDAIGEEISDPFGTDKNDLPLDAYCDALRKEADTVSTALNLA